MGSGITLMANIQSCIPLILITSGKIIENWNALETVWLFCEEWDMT